MIWWNQSEVGSIDWEIKPEKGIKFLVFYCFENPSIAHNFGTTGSDLSEVFSKMNLSKWVLQSIRKLKMLQVRLQSDFPRLHHYIINLLFNEFYNVKLIIITIMVVVYIHFIHIVHKDILCLNLFTFNLIHWFNHFYMGVAHDTLTSYLSRFISAQTFCHTSDGQALKSVSHVEACLIKFGIYLLKMNPIISIWKWHMIHNNLY